MKRTLLSISLFLALGVQGQTFVDVTATGNNDGSSWANAYTSLVTALDFAGVNEEIWVAEGVYLTSTSGVRTHSHHIRRSGVKMYGGFNGTETSLNQRDFMTNTTTLSGDIDGDPTSNLNNAFTVVRIDGTPGATATDVLVDGFDIRDGFSNGNSDHWRFGGGVFIGDYATDVTIQNCNIFHNQAHGGGGVSGVVSYGFDLSVTIENCRITENQARWRSGFEFVAEDGRSVEVKVINCLVDNNIVDLINSEQAFTGAAGGLSTINFGTLNAHFINSTFTQNDDYGLGADPADKGVFMVSQFTTQPQDIGNITLTVDNCIFWNNDEAVTFNKSTHPYHPSSVYINNSITADAIDSNVEPRYTLVNLLNDNPLFVDPDADFSLQEISPAVDEGSATGLTALLPDFDLAGNSRVFGSEIDLGCYELQEPSLVSQNAINDVVVTVSPNPVRNVLTVSSDNHIQTLSISNMMGQMVRSTTGNRIDLSGIDNGLYVITVSTEAGEVQELIIKN